MFNDTQLIIVIMRKDVFIDKDVTCIICQLRSKQMDKVRRLVHKQIATVTNDNCKHKFHKRLRNLTSIELTDAETGLLCKGLKYNLPKYKMCIRDSIKLN